jgi:hypothetical protein
MIKGKGIIRDENGTLTISYEDLQVESFGGADYEAVDFFDQQNRNMFETALRKEGLKGTLKEMIMTRFGIFLDGESICAWCRENGIHYELFTWID